MARNHSIPIGDTLPSNSQISDIFSKRLGNGQSRIYIFVKCPSCDKTRWIRKDTIGKHERCLSCATKATVPKRSANYRWKGGRIASTEGYTRVLLEPEDFFFPMADKTGYVAEHRLIMARHLRRCLIRWEVVHHKNGVKTDNKLENLELLTATGKHNTQLNKEIKRQAKLIHELQQRVTLLETENIKLEHILTGANHE